MSDTLSRTRGSPAGQAREEYQGERDRSVMEAREALSESLELQVYAPGEPGGWDEAYKRFEDMLEEDNG